MNRPGPTRIDPARAWRYLTAYFSIALKDTNSKLLHITEIAFEFNMSKFDWVIQNYSGKIAFFIEAVFDFFLFNFAYKIRLT